MKKIMYGAVIGYFALCVAVVAWMFGCPKSYGKFISKWQEKVEEGIDI